MRAAVVAWVLIAIALGVLAAQTFAFRARANDLTARVAAVRAEADGLGARVDAVRGAIDDRAGEVARRTAALADHAGAIAERVDALGAAVPTSAGAVCLERTIDAIEGGTAPHWTYACLVAPGRHTLALDGKITAIAGGGDGATVHVTCDACSVESDASRVDATWTGLGAVRLRPAVFARARVLAGDVSVECPKVNERCAARVALRIQ